MKAEWMGLDSPSRRFNLGAAEEKQGQFPALRAGPAARSKSTALESLAAILMQRMHRKIRAD